VSLYGESEGFRLSYRGLGPCLCLCLCLGLGLGFVGGGTVSFRFRSVSLRFLLSSHCLPFLGNRAARARGVGKTNRISMEKIP
jgi:hypothetical protein